MSTITKADLANLLHENLGVNKREAAEIVMSFFDEISGELEKGATVKLSGFGPMPFRIITSAWHSSCRAISKKPWQPTVRLFS